MAQVQLNNVGKTYDNGFVAVNSLNVEVNDKEFVVLLGPSGCGKTTTLRMIAGLEEVTSGELSIAGKVVNNIPPKDRDIAMVFQNYALYPHMNVFENMAFGLKLRKIPKKEINERVSEAARVLKLESLLDRKPKQLSGGQRQRVALGRAIVRKPRVFLFDEPLSNLDAKLRAHMRAELASLHTRINATMIYVTHDQIEAMTLGDRIIIMKDGVIQQVGTPLDLYDNPVNRFVAGFIGSPPMNLFDVDVKRSSTDITFTGSDVNIKLSFSKFPKLKKYEADTANIGIRPEDMTFSVKKKEDNYISGVAKVVEHLGAETYVYLPRGFTEEGETFLIVKLGRNDDIKVNQSTSFTVDTAKLHVFDSETGDSII